VSTLDATATFLAIEASTSAGSVALWQNGRLAGVEMVSMGVGREDRLFPAIQQLLAGAGIAPRALQAVVCGEGPGSFTSLRIGASLAKGLAHGAGCPLFAVPSLLIAAASATSALVPGHYLVHADALRGERYVLPVLCVSEGEVVPAGPLARIPAEALAAEAAAPGRLAVGPSPFNDEYQFVEPNVGDLLRAQGQWRAAAVSLAQWEPVYGRLAEAQVKWEASHGQPLPDAPAVYT